MVIAATVFAKIQRLILLVANLTQVNRVTRQRTKIARDLETHQPFTRAVVPFRVLMAS
jgi:hypothetical protein